LERISLTHRIPAGSPGYFVREDFQNDDIPARKPALIMLHGFAGSGASFSHLLSELLKHYRVFRPDLAGHGETGGDDPERMSVDAQRDDIASLAEYFGLERITLYGYSMGARLALQYALGDDVRIRRLILESGSAGIEDEAEREKRRASDERLAKQITDHFSSFVEHWDSRGVFSSPAVPDPELSRRMLNIRQSQNPASLAASLRGFGTGTMPYAGNRLGELGIPVTLLSGEADQKFTRIAREMAACIAPGKATHHVIEGCGHRVHLEKPQRVTGILTGNS
jgi:2-succinyl-6-hydroxy-2,4-cyclohexadiene-1-carboxylate synthase